MTNSRALLALSASVLLLSGCAAGDPGDLANAGVRRHGRVEKLTDKAEAAIARRRGDAAVRYAEQAVALAPSDAARRGLLARAYLQAGRFTSAAQAAADALSLDPRDGRAALHLALAQTALGDWTAARATLTTHAELLRPIDRGLALALAGDPLGGAVLIGEEARGPTASATARQNLALALALAGRWPEARAVAAVDLAPDEVERRMQQWLQFVRPTTSSQQVATLLRITPAEDPGQPVALALVRPEAAVAVAAVAAPTPEAPVETAEPAPQPAASGGVQFAPRQEIVQAIPVQVAAQVPPPAPAQAHVPRAAALAQGGYYVQLGAHENAGVARDAWGKAQRRYKALAGLTPSAVAAQVGGASFYRLSVGGFAQPQAVALCRRLRAQGGRCFVRAQAGDAVASWARGNTQLAAR
jgi:Flp pilus assembly protein TadD